ncbi:MAG: right-handed parallel beta-helix repeat-containing protein [bacterium]
MKRAFIPLLLFTLMHASLAQLSGPLSGTLGPGTYHVIDTISVESTDTLQLMPGTTFTFDGGYPFQIYGTLLAEGTESDSIIFTTEQSDMNRWRGLRFEGAGSSGSRLGYCLIERGYAIGASQGYRGGGICCWNYSSPTFTNCTIRDNWASDGGGVSCYYSSSPEFMDCTISANLGGEVGGGVRCYESSPTFRGVHYQWQLGSVWWWGAFLGFFADLHQLHHKWQLCNVRRRGVMPLFFADLH